MVSAVMEQRLTIAMVQPMLDAVNAQHGKSRKGAQVPSCRAHRGSSHQEICVCVFSSVPGSNPVLAKLFLCHRRLTVDPSDGLAYAEDP